MVHVLTWFWDNVGANQSLTDFISIFLFSELDKYYVYMAKGCCSP